MDKEYELYYNHFQDNSVDAERAAIFDKIVDDPFFTDELKNKMHEWHRILVTIKNMGDIMAKSFVVSLVRFIMSPEVERHQSIRLGKLHNSLAPKVKRTT